MGNKGEFPELGQDNAKGKAHHQQDQPKAHVGGPIGQVSAPAKQPRTQNKFDNLRDKDEQ